jgi:hypothetical protein
VAHLGRGRDKEEAVTAEADRSDRIRELLEDWIEANSTVYPSDYEALYELIPPGSVVLTADEAEQIKGAIRNLLIPWIEEAVGPMDAIAADCDNAERALVLLGEEKP